MLFYLGFAISPLIVALLTKCYYKVSIDDYDKPKKVFLFWSGLIIFLAIALRNRFIGSTDSQNYYNNWLTLSELSYEEANYFIQRHRMESGYLYCVWVLSHVFPNPQYVFVFSGLLFTISVCSFIYKNSDDCSLSVVMFITLGLYTFMVQGLRQSVAMSICLYAYESAKKRKLINFLLLILLAMQFHKSAISFSLVYLINWKSIDFKSKLVMIGVMIALFLAMPVIISVGNSIVEGDYGIPVESGGIVATSIHLILLVGAIVLVDHDLYSKDELSPLTGKKEAFALYLTVLSAAFYLMRYFGALALERISFYFVYGQLIILPVLLNRLRGKDKIIIRIIAIALCVLLFLYRMRGSDLLPYRFYWQ